MHLTTVVIGDARLVFSLAESPVSFIFMSYATVTHRKKNMCNYPPSRIAGQFGQPPGGEDELPSFISVFCKQILVNTDRISRRLYMKDSNAVCRELNQMEVNHVRCSGCSQGCCEDGFISSSLLPR